MPDASPQLREYARLLREQLRLSERIINDVLDRARSGAPVHSVVDITELLDDIVIRAALPAHIRVERKDVSPLPPVALDRDHVGPDCLESHHQCRAGNSGPHAATGNDYRRRRRA